jgi:hypothetical protein
MLLLLHIYPLPSLAYTESVLSFEREITCISSFTPPLLQAALNP